MIAFWANFLVKPHFVLPLAKAAVQRNFITIHKKANVKSLTHNNCENTGTF
jgi:hypothetical protein